MNLKEAIKTMLTNEQIHFIRDDIEISIETKFNVDCSASKYLKMIINGFETSFYMFCYNPYFNLNHRVNNDIDEQLEKFLYKMKLYNNLDWSEK